jgi:type I restriction-modification system DNA methylase subunit
VRDRHEAFHREWLGLAQPIEGLVFSIPALVEAQIAPVVRTDLTARFRAELAEIAAEAASSEARSSWGIPHARRFFERFLGYGRPGHLVGRDALSPDLSFYAAEGGQLLQPSFAIARGPFDAPLDPFADLDLPPAAPAVSPPPPAGSAATPRAGHAARYWALVWDLTEDAEPHAGPLDLDRPETRTGGWRYPPTAKLERLLRHTQIPIGFLFNGAELRLVYAPPAETTAHLTFRVADLREPAGRPLLAALTSLVGAERATTAAPAFTLEGLLAESRKRQADVTEALARQVFEAIELLVAGFERAAERDATGNQLDWLRPALEADADHFYQGVLTFVLRLVFLLYAEDQSLLPVESDLYATHFSLSGLIERLARDAAAHPESMHQRFGAYGHLTALSRAIYFGARHGDLTLPARRGKLFDPNAFPFLEGGQPDWTAAVGDPAARAAVHLPSLDDGTLHEVLQRLVFFGGQRLSYRALDVEQIGSVYESLMGYHVLRVTSPAVRVGKAGVWIEIAALRARTKAERDRYLKDECDLSSAQITRVNTLLGAASSRTASDEALAAELAAALGVRGADSTRPAGRLVLQPGEERRRTASHYTPRTLTEQIVARTLEPLLTCLGERRTADQLLRLKICDPSMGSGAFLVAACRALAAEVVAAWARAGELERILEAHGRADHHAQRLVAERCLYGVDKNPAAVELAKLSLWLLTLSKDKPFSFLDHALRHGDSLVGLDLQQIGAFHWQRGVGTQLDFCAKLLRDSLARAVALRQELESMPDTEDDASQAEKRRLFEFAQQEIDRVRTVADVCVGAFFAEEADAARERERVRRLDLVRQWLGSGGPASGAELAALAQDAKTRLAPFHWWIELPEVFFEARPDPLDGDRPNGAAHMEAVIGNPPFGGKNTLTSSSAPGTLDWLKAVHEGAHGNSDLSAHFFRRAAHLLGHNGALGLLATNTIAQGDTRATALQPLVAKDWTIYDATTNLPWPGAAAVTVSVVHLAHGKIAPLVHPHLDGDPVPAISSRLRAGAERADPQPLAANADSSFQGSIVLGLGFTLTPAERDALVAKDPKNAERIFPYLGGEEVNTSPTQTFDRYVISFGTMTLEEAEAWPDLIRIVREKVKPERDRNNREVRRRYWWRFGEVAPALYEAIAPLERCLVTARVSKHLMLSMQPRDRIFSEQLYIFPLDGYSAFGVLQSRLHEPWARLLSSSMKTDLRYSASDCFETFPFPQPDPRTVLPTVEAAGRALYDARARFMVESTPPIGLTKTYNALKDPAHLDPRVHDLRALHEALDRAVLDAYGWSDLPVPPFCPRTPDDHKAVARFSDAVIDRLYQLNEERAAAESRAGAHATTGARGTGARGTGAARRRPATGKRTKATPGQGRLIEEDD